jgi:hypothetical protein
MDRPVFPAVIVGAAAPGLSARAGASTLIGALGSLHGALKVAPDASSHA